MWDSITENSCELCFNTRFNSIEKDSPSKMNDLSMYESNSPMVTHCESPSQCTHSFIRRPSEDHDSNSQDSGYSASFQSEYAKFMTYASQSRGSFQSFGSSMEDESLEDFSDVQPLGNQENNLPTDFAKLIDGPLIDRPKLTENKQESVIRPLFRRALSLYNPTTTTTKITPNSSRVRSCLFKENLEVRSFKRPEPPTAGEFNIIKKSKIFDEDDGNVPVVPTRPTLQRHFSATEESIMSAVQRSAVSNDLIGDFSKSFCLPLTDGRHQDLKAITPSTLAGLINGEYDHSVASYKVIDCRYPYEFDGGHIAGALNVYTKEQCLELLEQNKVSEQHANKRHILVFHCEFSSERGPNLYRYIRKQDRQKNMQEYPALTFPEIYLLEGGYKNFFQDHSDMCIPIAYKQMLHPEHEEDLRHFRQKSKTWNSDTRCSRPQYNRSKRFARLDV
ncbi:unnamed protein product [Brassicogethes aeneus]|uniref:protein-tyrosine-phosphatase n=1 Tax=Brassicogethes aeneus TaxID=1431903 RepID=A0A9P0FMP9_BRAAE|nr:unnamed protein product [Brassicogethes aeneus]